LQPSQYFTLIDTLARFHLKAEARRFGLGYLWWILEPMLYVGVFYLVFVLFLGNRQPDFLVFLAVGKLAFIWFSKSVNQASLSLVNSREVLGQTNLPKHLFPVAVMHEGVYRQAAVFAFLLVLVLALGYAPTAAWVWLIPVVVTQYLLILACGLGAAILVCLQRDFQMLIQLGMVFLLFMSGVFWDISTLTNPSAVFWLETLNPLAVLLDSYRQILLSGRAPDSGQLVLIGFQSTVLIGIMMWLYRRLHFWLAERAISQ
jgi:lipopolysaccharide transport system permease protein